MDPDTCLKDIRSLVARIMSYDLNIVDVGADEYEEKTTELAEKFVALDLWLSGKGFLPKAWDR
jgi:hypothetical protein